MPNFFPQQQQSQPCMLPGQNGNNNNNSNSNNGSNVSQQLHLHQQQQQQPIPQGITPSFMIQGNPNIAPAQLLQLAANSGGIPLV